MKRERGEMKNGLGIPVRVLQEATGFVITVELKCGDLYRGSLFNCEDNWNLHLYDVTFTSKDGKVSPMEHVFIRGNKVRFIIIPDMLKNAPMFKRLTSRIKDKTNQSKSTVALQKKAEAAAAARGAAKRWSSFTK